MSVGFPMKRRLPALAGCLALLGLGGLPAAALAAVFTVGGATGSGLCTHASLQSAINAAAASPGLDIIRVTRGAYAAQRVVVNDSGDLAIEGGYLECATPVRVDFTTLDGQGASPRGPVIAHQGAGRLTLSDLQIRNGYAYGAGVGTTFGGGVSSSGTGALTVYRSLIVNNTAGNGGGMYVGTNAGLTKDVTLVGVGFNSNGAAESGGGLYVLRGDVKITGDDASYFAANHADSADINHGGGALYALDSIVRIDGKPPAASPFMDGNSTASNGGAIYFASLSAGWRSLWMENRAGGAPLTIANNSATRFGGAIYVRSTATGGVNNATVTLYNGIVSANRAGEGGAFYLYGNGNDNDNAATLTLATSEPGYAAPACAAGLRCNRVDGNISGQGPTIVLEQLGTRGRANLFFKRGHLVDNSAVNGGGLIYGDGYVFIDNSVIGNNDAGNSVLIGNGSGSIFQIQNSTVAGNLRITPSVFKLYATGGTLRLHNSIAFQPGAPVFQAVAGTTADLRNLLVGDSHGLVNLAALNIQQTSDPLFANAAQSDFRLQQGSQAINRWSPGSGVNVPTVDLLGATRPAPPSGAPTPYDFGAYEFGAVVDLIFDNGFQ